MTRIVLNLSGSWSHSIFSSLHESDVVLHPSGMPPAPSKGRFRTISSLTDPQERGVADDLCRLCECLPDSAARELLACFINDYFSYSVKPMCETVVSIRKILDEYSSNHLSIVVPRSASRRLPMLGLRTAESLRGSRTLLHARYAPMLKDVFPHIYVEYIWSSKDIFTYEVLRRIIIGTANWVFCFLFLVRVLMLTLLTPKKEAGPEASAVAIVRVAHHVRFVRRLIEGISGRLKVVVLPQASQGGLRHLLSLRGQLTEMAPLVRVPIPAILGAVWRAGMDRRRLTRISTSEAVGRVFVMGMGIPVSMSDLANEIRLASVTLIYYRLVRSLFKGQHYRLINFELVGRMAGLEALAARRAGCESVSIQSALISSRALPFFPYSDKFFADSAPVADKMNEIGSYRGGAVCYAGPPFPIGSLEQSRKNSDILFLTQPYEHDISLGILREIAGWARDNCAKVKVRFHPRDERRRYLSFLDVFGDTVSETKEPLEDEIAAHSVMVTRTSSVAKEALALGRPVILCLWSPFDRSIRADYVLDAIAPNYCAYNAEQLRDLLSRPQLVTESAKRLRSCLFQGLSVSDLRTTLDLC